jgi:Na+/melibiose symporter-like transporter
MFVAGIVPLVYFSVTSEIWRQSALLLVYFVAVLGNVVAVVYQVAIPSLLPRLFGRESIMRVNSRLTATNEIAYGVGPVLAGLAVASIGEPSAVGINALSFGVAALAWYFIKANRSVTGLPDAPTAVAHGHLVGVRFMWLDPMLRSLGCLEVLSTILAAGATSLFIYFVTEHFGLGSIAVGLVLTLGSAGAAIAAVSAPALRSRTGLGRAWLVGLAVQSVALALVPLAGSIILVAALAVVFGFGQVLSAVLALSYRQERTPDSLLGRVNAAMRVATLAAQAAGGAASTALAVLESPQRVLTGLGAAGLLLFVCGLATPLGRREYTSVGAVTGTDQQGTARDRGS